MPRRKLDPAFVIDKTAEHQMNAVNISIQKAVETVSEATNVEEQADLVLLLGKLNARKTATAIWAEQTKAELGVSGNDQ